MKQEEIVENNKIIAQFMDEEYSLGLMNQPLINHKTIGYTPIKYHSSWDWLMPVVDRIVDSGFLIQIEMIDLRTTRVYFNMITGQSVGNGYRSESRIEAVYMAVIEFIIFHNQQNK